MSNATTIEWTDATWNPVRGCSIVSKGCTNCYAMRQAHRQNGNGGAYEGLTVLSKGGPVWTGKIRLVPELLDAPLHWKRPRRIFVNSMSDLFHEDVNEVFIGSVLGIASACTRHSFQVLTKRPQRMLNVLRSPAFLDAYESSQEMYTHTEIPWPAPNVWLGVSVEDQPSADERIPLLLQTPAAMRWISAEPLLGPVRIDDLSDGDGGVLKPLCGLQWEPCVDREGKPGLTVKKPAGARIDWVVAGGESGPGARPMHPDWARSLRDQCAAAGVPFFFKQWGNFLPGELCRGDPVLRWQSGATQWYGDAADIKLQDFAQWSDENRIVFAVREPKKKAGRQLDGRTHDEYPA